MTAWRTAALELWCRFGWSGFTAGEAVRAARHDPALDDALMALAGSLDVDSVETAIKAHVNEVAHGARLHAWPAANGATVFCFVSAEAATTGAPQWR